MSSPDLSPKEQKIRNMLIGGFAALGMLTFLYEHFVVTPRATIYRQELLSLHAEQVQTLRLHTEVSANGKRIIEERLLKGDELVKFLALISDARPYGPSHPYGGWTCYVDIDTTTYQQRFSLQIRSTANNGVYYTIWSDPVSHDGWNYGSFRNDALGPFIVKAIPQIAGMN